MEDEKTKDEKPKPKETITKKLNLGERFTAMNLLPEKGNIFTQKAIIKAKEALTPTDEEVKEYGIVAKEEGGISWNAKKATVTKTIELSAKAVTLIEEALQALNDKNELEQIHVTLFDKFVGE